MLSDHYGYRMKVKADNLYVLTNAGDVVSEKDCAPGKYWLYTNSPSYLEMYVRGDKLEVVSPIEEVPKP